MPTYVYECSTCNDVFEVEQRITEDALTDCQCGSKGSLRRVIQPVGIAFKGTGFYVNDASGSCTSTASSTEPTNCGTADSPCACAMKEA